MTERLSPLNDPYSFVFPYMMASISSCRNRRKSEISSNSQLKANSPTSVYFIIIHTRKAWTSVIFSNVVCVQRGGSSSRFFYKMEKECGHIWHFDTSTDFQTNNKRAPKWWRRRRVKRRLRNCTLRQFIICTVTSCIRRTK